MIGMFVHNVHSDSVTPYSRRTRTSPVSRAFFFQEHMIYIAPQNSIDGIAKVICQSEDGKASKMFEAPDWLAQLTTHIPNKANRWFATMPIPLISRLAYVKKPAPMIISQPWLNLICRLRNFDKIWIDWFKKFTVLTPYCVPSARDLWESYLFSMMRKLFKKSSKTSICGISIPSPLRMPIRLRRTSGNLHHLWSIHITRPGWSAFALFDTISFTFVLLLWCDISGSGPVASTRYVTW